MARKKSDINKSAEIRAVLELDRLAPARDVVDALAAKGIVVRQQDVYNVRSSMNTNGKKGKPGRKAPVNGQAPAQPTAKAATGSAVQVVLQVKSLAGQVGGLKYLKQLVDALAE